MKIHELSVTDAAEKLACGQLTSVQLVEAFKQQFESDEQQSLPIKGYIEWFDDAVEKAVQADCEREQAKKDGTLETLLAKKPLLGIPFAAKDNISIKGKNCTCGSRILFGYKAPYSATVIQRLLDAGAIPLGRTNMDEFAMGSSTEYSCYGPSRNPVLREHTPGGSSGGSAAVVAGAQAPFSLGTETGGSVRLPASYCGIYGLKPTYGALSRWGVVAFGSSLDQVGLFGREPADIALPFSVMAGSDFYDDTSADCDTADCKKLQSTEIKGMRLAIPKQFLNVQGLDAQVAAIFEQAREWFVSQGATVEIIDMPVLEASIACYYVIALSEAASNLSRFDGIRYGLRKDEGDGYDELYTATRSDGFGAEVKRRIVIGNYVLSTNFSGDCYKKAMAVRARIQREVSAVLKSFDLILCPTGPTGAFKLGERVDDPMSMYLSDLFTTFVNLSRIPAISVPAGTTQQGLPVGVQFAGAHFGEGKLLRIAQTWHEGHKNGGKSC